MRWVIVLLALAWASRAEEAPPVREISPGVLQVGVVRVERATRRVVVPAKVNQVEGPLEYLLVAEHGPTHESLLVTAAAPRDVHVAMLLLGAKGAPGTVSPPSGPLNAEDLGRAPTPVGETVKLVVRWAGKEVAAEELLRYGDPPGEVTREPWVYTGSPLTGAGKFAAQVEGYVAALVTNPYALINNPRPNRTDDQHWQANRALVPPLDTAVEVEIRLAP